MNRFQKYLVVEIGIEYKACLYFFAMGFFYCMYRLLGGRAEASILHLGELILSTYAMGYVQVYFLRNFDEGERFDLFAFLASLGCTGVYVLLSWLFAWFDRQGGATVLFAGYVLFLYGCMFAVNKVKRTLDTKLLNTELEAFKQHRKE